LPSALLDRLRFELPSALLDRRHAEGLLPPRREALLRARNDGGSR